MALVNKKADKKVSTNKRMLKQAMVDSMNNANIDGNPIEDGDYVLIDAGNKNINNNDYVLSTIEGLANIKKFIFNKINKHIVLISESQKDYPPIIINSEEDYSYIINGKVFQVIKVPK